MITKAQAMALQLGDLVRHKNLVETIHGETMYLHAKVRETCIVDKNKPNYFSVRVQSKLGRWFNIIELTAGNWDVVKQGARK